MESFEYHRPQSLAEAWALKRERPDARFIAGGTDVMVRMREGKIRPPALISLRGLRQLSYIEVGSPTRIGALTPVADVLAHAGMREAHPVFARAARRLGSTQIRNAATVGGNLCNASPCADMATPLLVHEARLIIASPEGERELPLEDFFVAPGATRLGADEIVTEIRFDPPPDDARAAFFKKGRVRMDIALASLSVLIGVRNGRCGRARVAAGSVGPRPMRLPRTEAVLEGAVLSNEVIAEAGRTAAAEVQPITDVRATAGYRRHIIGVYVRRAVAEILSGVAS